MPDEQLLFAVETRLGFVVDVTVDRWQMITSIKHPAMRERENAVRTTLAEPEQIRRSRSDAAVLLFYRQTAPSRWVCCVVKRLTATTAFLITAYPTDAIKEGELIWSD